MQSEVDRLTRERDHTKHILANRVYDLCPNGKPFNKCDHEELKAQFVAWQTDMRNRIVQYDADITHLQDQYRRLSGELNPLAGQEAALNAESISLKDEYRKYFASTQQERSDLERKIQGVRAIDAKSHTCEQHIVATVVNMRALEKSIQQYILGVIGN